MNSRGSFRLWTFHAVVPSVSGPLWPGVDLMKIVTSTHCFSSGDLVELDNMRECMSQVVVVSLQCIMCLDSPLENIYHMLQYHFPVVMYWVCTNLVMILTVDWVWCTSVPTGFGCDNYVRRTMTSLGVFNIIIWSSCWKWWPSGHYKHKWWECIVMSWAFNWVVYRLAPSYWISLLAFYDILLLASPQCVEGFLNEEAVRIAADVHGSIRNHRCQKRIIPGINFTCTGTLTKWIIGAQRTLTQTTNHLQLQIWKRQGDSNTYGITNFSGTTSLNVTSDLNVYEYIPNPPRQFRIQANDILGLH